MKVRKKLTIDSDCEGFPPPDNIESESNSQRGFYIGKDKVTSQNKASDIQSCQSIQKYLISIKEPTNYRSSQNVDDLFLRPKPNHQKLNRIQEEQVKTQKHLSGLPSISYTHSHSRRVVDKDQEITLNRQISRMQEEVVKSKKGKTCKLFFQNNNILQGKIKKLKIAKIANNFVKKLRRCSTLYPPVQYQKVQFVEHSSILYFSGIQLPPIIDSILSFLSVVQILTLLVIYSLAIVFSQVTTQYSFISILQTGSLVFYFTEICLNLVTVKFSAGKKLSIIKQILEYYTANNFWVDFISFIILFIDITTSWKFIMYFRLFIILKLPQCFDKIQKIQVYFIQNIYNEQYWELTKVFLVNFGYAHIIALILIAMSNLDPTNNWIISRNLQDAPWGQVYIWAFYWSTTIMLTVGFGDIVAVNYKESIFIVFIQTFSCIIMAYNINRVGIILANIKRQDQNRSKKFKIFKKLTTQSSVSEELAFKINNYIEESSKMKKHFNFEQDKQFLEQLPQNLRVTYLREANREVFTKLIFFCSLLDRTLCNFAQHLQVKISHPQEIIRALDDDFNLLILRKGHIGYICKKSGSSFNEFVADQIKVKQKQNPFLTSLDFVSKIRPTYQIKSLQFSVLYTLGYETFIQFFRDSDMDYELYCFMRDKCRNIPDQFQVYKCQFCQHFNHFKFTCPRLHYIPYEQHVIDKEIYKEKINSNKRRNFNRPKNLVFTPLQYYKKIKNYQEKPQNGSKERDLLHEQLLQTLSAAKDPSFKSEEKLKKQKQINGIYLQNLFDEKTRQVMEIQLLKKENKKNFQDQIWIINLDVLTNFNSYFHNDNPKFLAQKFSQETRLAKKKLKQQNKLFTNRQGQKDPVNSLIHDYKYRISSENPGTDLSHLSMEL